MSRREKWLFEMPVWVSRKNSDGLIAQATVPMWLFMLLYLIILVNILAWGCIGLYTAAMVVA